ncbi:MAG: hypothetical protein JW987_05455 [Anaerolineaceae bacterium]|nr:hypothetical protein [Anaerolineaceae bacterium]
MNLHIVGGFLGSGKTTAIIGAAKRLMASGKRVAIITNDQGKYLVDTAFFRAEGMPTVEVTGGCFCCRFDDLEKHLDFLRDTVQPDAVYSESVGSCADIVATVIKPLQALRSGAHTPTSLSVFTDSRLLLMRLLNEPLPFSDSVVYIFDQQIEESSLLVVNKIDLLAPEEQAQIRRQATERYPGKTILFQDSRSEEDVRLWLEAIQPGRSPLPSESLEIDYQRYGQGEAELAWLDKELTLQAPHGAARQVAIHFIEQILGQLAAAQAAVAHLKLFITCGHQHTKLSITASSGADWRANLPQFGDEPVQVEFNARVQTDPQTLDFIFTNALTSVAKITGVQVQSAGLPAFKPGFPKPTHRIAGSS